MKHETFRFFSGELEKEDPLQNLNPMKKETPNYFNELTALLSGYSMYLVPA